MSPLFIVREEGDMAIKKIKSKAKMRAKKAAAKKKPTRSLRQELLARAREKRSIEKKRPLVHERYLKAVQKFETAPRGAEFEPRKIAPEMPKAFPSHFAAQAREELPAGYGEDKIVAQVRDPHWIHAYWELTQDTKHKVESQLRKPWSALTKNLRVYDVTDIIFDGRNAHSYFDITVNDDANNWYINTKVAGRSYCVDIGILNDDGTFIRLARSNVVTTPRDSVSPVVDEEWMIPDDMFARLYALSGGLKIGASSAELKELMKKRLAMELASGAVSSISSPMARPKEKGFWLLINAELILYGATEPGAKLTVQDRPVALRPDGTFSLRFALPDGKQILPVSATSKDGKDCESITAVVTRETHK